MSNFLIDHMGKIMLALMALLIVLSYTSHTNIVAKATEECEQVGGKLVYNGKFYECYKR